MESTRYNAFRSYSSTCLRRSELKDIHLDLLKCHCCGRLLKDCLTLQDDGFTTLAYVPDPDRFKNLSGEFLQQDASGRALYIPLCGINGYDIEET